MHAIQSYRARRAETASPAQVIVLLLQEGVRRLELAAQSMEQDKDPTPHLRVARDVVSELHAALGPVPGGEVLFDGLTRIYTWCASEIVVGGHLRSPEKLRSVRRVLIPLIEGFVEASAAVAS